MQRVVRCQCGQEMRVPAQALHRYGKCVACGARLKITEFNSRLTEAAPAAAEAGLDADAPQDRCAACGREFRGDWDKYPGTVGLVCDLCARQAGDIHEPPPELGADNVSLHDDRVAPISFARLSIIEKPRKRKPPPTRKEVIVLLAATAAALLMVVLLPVEEYAAQFFSVSEEDLKNPSHGELAASILAMLLVDFAFYCGILYAGLTFCGLLPSEDPYENFKAIGVAAVLLILVSFVPFLAPLLQILLIAFLFGLDILHIPAFILAGLIMMPMKMAMEGLVYGTLAALLASL